MSKPVLGIILGCVLGFIDGGTAYLTPEVRPYIMTILIGSAFKGMIAGIVIGFFARKINSMPIGILFGLGVAMLVTFPFAIAEDPNTGKTYFLEIMLPGSLLGVIVGYATQKYGKRPAPSNNN